MNAVLWVVQAILAVYFLFTGLVHFIVPPGLPAPMSWMYELSTELHRLSGTLEILAAIGLVVPALTRIQTRLVSLAALGLVLVMFGAAIWHTSRGEAPNVAMNVFLAALAGFVAFGRWRLRPLAERARVAPSRH